MPSEIHIFVPAAIRAILGSLAPRMAAEAGAPLVQIVDLNPEIPRRIAAGEAFDIGLTNPGYVQGLIESGHADEKSHRPFGRVPLAVCRQAAEAGPLLTEPQQIAALLRGAESIAYTGAGTSGRLYREVLARLGIADSVMAKSRAMRGGVPAASVAAGEAELAIAPLTTILATPGVVPAAVFGDALETHIDMSIFLNPRSRAGAMRILAFLTSGALDAELAAAGISRFELT